MAHARAEIKLRLSTDSIREAVDEIEQYKAELLRLVDEFVERLAAEGVEVAKARLREAIRHPDLSTGNLESSITMRKGDAVHNGSSWIVYTGNPYARYVEFGTGPVGASKGHPSGGDIHYRSTGWAFRRTGKPAGWVGPTITGKDGVELAVTNGQPAKAFMYKTWSYLKEESTIKRIAKEVFG